MKKRGMTMHLKKGAQKKPFLKGCWDGVPIMLGYISVSFVFGVMCTKNGLPTWFSTLISATSFTSAGQFAGTGILLTGGALFEIAVTTFIINIRYTLMSVSLSQRVEMNSWQRALCSFGVTDEVFGVAMQSTGPVTFPYMVGLILLPYTGWVLGSFLGAAVTDLLSPELRSALGIAIYGMFVAIIIPPAKKLRPVLVCCVLSILIACLFRWTPPRARLSSGWVVIVAAVTAAAFAARRFPIRDEEG